MKKSKKPSNASRSATSNQIELNLLYVVAAPLANDSEPKAEPFRSDLDAAWLRLSRLVRSAVQQPTGQNINAVANAIRDAHKNLYTLTVVESQLAHG